MTARLRVMHNGALRDVINLKVKDLGILRNLKTLKVMDGGSLRLVANFVQEMSVVATSPAIDAGDTKGPLEANVTGGLAPYTYAWTEVSDPDGINATINSPTSASTTVTRTGALTGGATFRVTVTDALGTVASDDIPISWSSSGGSS